MNFGDRLILKINATIYENRVNRPWVKATWLYVVSTTHTVKPPKSIFISSLINLYLQGGQLISKTRGCLYKKAVIFHSHDTFITPYSFKYVFPIEL